MGKALLVLVVVVGGDGDVGWYRVVTGGSGVASDVECGSGLCTSDL